MPLDRAQRRPILVLIFLPMPGRRNRPVLTESGRFQEANQVPSVTRLGGPDLPCYAPYRERARTRDNGVHLMKSTLRHQVTVVACCSIAACATVDFDYPKEETHALTDTSDTHFGRLLADIVAAHPDGEAGFYPMNDAIDALATRLLMAERAEKTIDAQYYLLTADVVGNAFIEVLLRAADRGVRVRLLLDDILTSGYDEGMAALDSHPNFEIRIFNPFAHRSFRAIDGITSFSRVNRRMHNKSFTVDNQITIIGGRNIAAEYFGAREDAQFGTELSTESKIVEMQAEAVIEKTTGQKVQ